MWEKKDTKAKVSDMNPLDNRTDGPLTSTSVINPASPSPSTNKPLNATAGAPLPGRELVPSATPAKEETVRIGRSISIKGEINGSQDLIIEGTVEGKVALRSNQVTVGQTGKIIGELLARHVIIFGQVNGNTYAEERVEIRSSGSLRGDIIAPRLMIEDGAYFKGSVEMESKKEATVAALQSTVKAQP